MSRVPVATLQGRAQASPLSKNLPSSSSCRSNQSPQSLKRSRYFSVGNASGARLPGANLSRHRASPQTREDRRTTWGPARRRPPAALLAGSHGGRLAPSAFSAGRAGANAQCAGFTLRRLDLGTHPESLSPSAGQHSGAGVPRRLAGPQAPTSELGAPHGGCRACRAGEPVTPTLTCSAKREVKIPGLGLVATGAGASDGGWSCRRRPGAPQEA